MFNPDEFSDEYRNEPIEAAAEPQIGHEAAPSSKKAKAAESSRSEEAQPVRKPVSPIAAERKDKPVIASEQKLAEEPAPVQQTFSISTPASPSETTAVSTTVATSNSKPARRRILPWAKEPAAAPKKAKRSAKEQDAETKEASKKRRKTTGYTVKQTQQKDTGSENDELHDGQEVMPKGKKARRRKAATPEVEDSEDEDMQALSPSPTPKRAARPRRAATAKQKTYAMLSDDDNQEHEEDIAEQGPAVPSEQDLPSKASLPSSMIGSVNSDRMMTEAGHLLTGVK